VHQDLGHRCRAASVFSVLDQRSIEVRAEQLEVRHVAATKHPRREGRNFSLVRVTVLLPSSQ
jgi:hypothetical protein